MAKTKSIESNLKRTPPQNLEAEESVIGGALLNQKACAKLMPLLRPDDFYSGANQEIWRAMLTLSAEHVAVDMITLTERLRQVGKLSEVGGATHLSELLDRVPTAANVEHYAKIVRQKSTLREVIREGTKVVLDAYDGRDLQRFLTESEQRLLAVFRRKTESVVATAQDTVLATMRYLHQEESPLIHTGIPTIDRRYGGLARGRVYAIGALTNVGKSVFAHRLQKGVLESGYSVLDFSLEMSKEENAIRYVADITGIENRRILAGMKALSDEEQLSVTRALNVIYERWIDTRQWIVVDENRPWPELLEIAYATAATVPNLRAVGVDYLQLIDGVPGKSTRREEIGEITRAWKTFARRTGMIVLEVSQLQRPEKKPRSAKARRAMVEAPPTLHDFAESASVERDADMIFLLWKQSGDSRVMGTVENRELHVEVPKCRFGPKTSFTLMQEEPYCRIEDWPETFTTEAPGEAVDAELVYGEEGQERLGV